MDLILFGKTISTAKKIRKSAGLQYSLNLFNLNGKNRRLGRFLLPAPRGASGPWALEAAERLGLDASEPALRIAIRAREARRRQRRRRFRVADAAGGRSRAMSRCRETCFFPLGRDSETQLETWDRIPHGKYQARLLRFHFVARDEQYGLTRCFVDRFFVLFVSPRFQKVVGHGMCP